MFSVPQLALVCLLPRFSPYPRPSMAVAPLPQQIYALCEQLMKTCRCGLVCFNIADSSLEGELLRDRKVVWC